MPHGNGKSHYPEASIKPSWNEGSPGTLGFSSKRQVEALKGAKEPSASFLQQTGLTKPSEPIINQLLAGAEKAAQMGKTQDTGILKDALKGADDKAAAKIIIKTAKTNTNITMKDTAIWTLSQMHNNLSSKDAKTIAHHNANFFKYMANSALSTQPPIPNTFGLMTGSSFEAFELEINGIKNKMQAYILWANLVAAGKQWDLKANSYLKSLTWEVVDPQTNRKYEKDIWGNIHYGFIGLAIGFTEYELRKGAGVAQLKTMFAQIKDKNDYEPLLVGMERVISNFFDIAELDTEADQSAITLGLLLWEKYGASLKLENFLQELRASNLSKA